MNPSGRSSGRLRIVAGVLALAVFAAACGGDTAGDEHVARPELPPTTRPSADEELTILHPYTGAEARAGLDAVIAAFNAEHPDIVVTVQTTRDIGPVVRAGVAAGAPADIVILPRLDLLAALASEGLVQPLDDFLDIVRLEQELVAGLLDLVRSDGRVFAVPLRLKITSLVWYSPAIFEARGYRTPDTWTELTSLSDRMIRDGLAPWCIGIESAGATGWVVTDWVEDILLRAIGVEAFDAWVVGDLAFASDEVRGALETYMVPIWTDDSAVAGGRVRIANESFGTSAAGILGEDPECGMHRQADLIEAFLAAADPDRRFGVDYDFFALPSIAEGDRPVLGGGEFAALLTESPSALRFLQFLTASRSGEPWAKRGGFLSPFSPVLEASFHADGSSRRASEILARATAFRSDGSDRMPPAVGSRPGPGSFWTEMAAWVSDEQSLEEALAAIDALYASLR